MCTSREFLAALVARLPRAGVVEARVVATAFVGDPAAVDKAHWRSAGVDPELLRAPGGEGHNRYVSVAAFRRAADGTWRRKKELFEAALAVMVDDVGTKVPRAVVEGAAPSARVETSPGNEQWWYLLERPECGAEGAARMERLVERFVAERCEGVDPGMKGLTRVGRLPESTNGKPAYGGAWLVRVKAWEPERRWTLEGLAEAWGLGELRVPWRRPAAPPPEDVWARGEEWLAAVKWLNARGMVNNRRANAGGWIEVTCPWLDDHTDRADTGAAIARPGPENGWTGAFRCHHGHCIEARGWRELTEWIAECAAEELDAAAAANN